MENIDLDHFSPQELHSAAKLGKSWAAPGTDGWLPLELKFLPIDAWVGRIIVEERFLETGLYPDVYYQAPITMLRKNDKKRPSRPSRHHGILGMLQAGQCCCMD